MAFMSEKFKGLRALARLSLLSGGTAAMLISGCSKQNAGAPAHKSDNAIAVDPTDDKRVWLAGAQGGFGAQGFINQIYESANSGGAWTDILTGRPGGAAVDDGRLRVHIPALSGTTFVPARGR